MCPVRITVLQRKRYNHDAFRFNKRLEVAQIEVTSSLRWCSRLPRGADSVRDSRSGILFWYSMALASTTIGLAAFYFGRTVGDPIAWTGRIATYLGGIYSLIAIWSASRGSHVSPAGPFTASV